MLRVHENMTDNTELQTLLLFSSHIFILFLLQKWYEDWVWVVLYRCIFLHLKHYKSQFHQTAFVNLFWSKVMCKLNLINNALWLKFFQCMIPDVLIQMSCCLNLKTNHNIATWGLTILVIHLWTFCLNNVYLIERDNQLFAIRDSTFGAEIVRTISILLFLLCIGTIT